VLEGWKEGKREKEVKDESLVLPIEHRLIRPVSVGGGGGEKKGEKRHAGALLEHPSTRARYVRFSPKKKRGKEGKP